MPHNVLFLYSFSSIPDLATYKRLILFQFVSEQVQDLANKPSSVFNKTFSRAFQQNIVSLIVFFEYFIPSVQVDVNVIENYSIIFLTRLLLLCTTEFYRFHQRFHNFGKLPLIWMYRILCLVQVLVI